MEKALTGNGKHRVISNGESAVTFHMTVSPQAHNVWVEWAVVGLRGDQAPEDWKKVTSDMSIGGVEVSCKPVKGQQERTSKQNAQGDKGEQGGRNGDGQSDLGGV